MYLLFLCDFGWMNFVLDDFFFMLFIKISVKASLTTSLNIFSPPLLLDFIKSMLRCTIFYYIEAILLTVKNVERSKDNHFT